MDTPKITDAKIVETQDENKSQGLVIWAVIIGLMFGFYIGRTIGTHAPEKLAVAEKVTETAPTPEKSAEETALKKPSAPTIIEITKEAQAPAAAIVPAAPKDTKVLTAIVSDSAPSESTRPNSISMNDQSAGDLVSVRSIILSRNGWVAVRENIDNEVGKVLGATWLPRGTHKDVSIELLRPTFSGHKYYAVLFVDDGDKEFSSRIDSMLDTTLTAFVAK